MGSVMKRPPSCGQHFKNRKIVERKIVAANHFFAGAVDHDLGKERAHLGELGQHLQLPEQAFRHAHFEELRDAARDFID